MPLLIGLGIAFFVVVSVLALLPLSLVLRYRAGTLRRRARGWVAAVNITGIAISALLFLLGAALARFWVPEAVRYALAGLAGGAALGLVGLWLSRFEATPGELHYTPNRWLVLAITLVVTGRILWSFWRGWSAWQASPDETTWVAAVGVAGSLAAGAVVLGYYLAYWTGLWLRVRSHRRLSAGWTAGGGSPTR